MDRCFRMILGLIQNIIRFNVFPKTRWTSPIGTIGSSQFFNKFFNKDQIVKIVQASCKLPEASCQKHLYDPFKRCKNYLFASRLAFFSARFSLRFFSGSFFDSFTALFSFDIVAKFYSWVIQKNWSLIQTQSVQCKVKFIYQNSSYTGWKID